MLKVVDRDQAKAWLRSIEGQVTHARLRGTHEPKPTTAVNIAFSAAGLAALGLGQETITSFPREFYLGMTRPEAPAILGDTGENAPVSGSSADPATIPFI